MEIVIDYQPRSQFKPYHARSERFAIGVAHRRAGKTVATINDLIKATITNPLERPRSAFITPLFNQAKDVAWTYLKHYAQPLLLTRPNESELFVELINGGRIRLYGADNPDRLRGIYLDDVVLDENADMHPRVWPEVIRPLLADRHGRATFIGTPKGHNAFRDMFLKAKGDPDWFAFELRASQTGIIPQHELDAARRDMSEDQYQQEFECSFDAAIQGAYYAKQLEAARSEGRITRLTRDPLMTIRAVWDIGGTGKNSDAVAIWIVQFVGKEVWVLDYYEAQGQPLAVHVAWLRANGYDKCLCILPHDGATNDRVFDVSFESTLKAAEFPTLVVPNQGAGAAMARVETARRIFPRCWFDEVKTAAGRAALQWYHEKRDELRNVGLGPDHNWASHGADAWGLVCVAYEAPKVKTEEIQAREVWTVGSDETAWLAR